MQEMIVQSLPVLWTAVLLPLLTLAGKWLVSWLAAKAKDTKWATAVEKLTDVATHVVEHVEVELRPDIQEAMKDGKLTPDEQAALKAKAVQLIKEGLGPDVLATLGSLAEPLISGAIERAVQVMNRKPEEVTTLAAADKILVPGGVVTVEPVKP